MRQRALILLPLLLIAQATVLRLQAQSGTTPAAGFTGLDVTILLDQSASMWQNPRNDRYAHRIGQSKNLIYRLAEHVEGTPLVHRLSVIDFGDSASVVLSNHVMRYDPSAPGGALRDAKVVVERVVIERPLVNTNTADAMRLALREYEKMDAAQALGGRRRVLLLITDGRPDLPNRPKLDLQAAVQTEAQSLKARNVELWVVGINDASNYWNEGDGAFWESVTGSPGHARLAETASSKIFTIMQDIADEWLGSKSAALKGDEYNCPPYLRRIVFSVNMGQPRSAVSVTDPDGQDIPASSGGPATNPGNFTRFVVDDPKVGIYKIKRDPARSYSWRVEETAADVKRLAPAKATGLEAPARILFQARENNGNPLELLDEYPINGVVTIAPPSGSPIELKADYLGDGKFGVSQWQPPALGAYRVRIKGLVRLKDGSEVDVFQSNASSYDEVLNVSNLRAYFVRLEDPQPASGFRVMKPGGESELRFVVVDAKGNKVANLASLVHDPASWLSLNLVDKSGAALSGPPPPLSLAADGTYSARLPAKLDWLRGEGWWSPGHLNIRLTEQSGRIAAGNYLDSIQLSQDEEPQRIGGDPLALALNVRFSWIILGAALLIALVIAGLALFMVLRKAFPKGLIWVADRYMGRTVALKIYDADIDPDGVAGKTFSITGGAAFKYDRTYSIPLDDRDYVAVRLRIKRALLVDRVEAGVLYSWDDDPAKNYTVNLRKGNIERLKGLPRSNFAITLDENP
ncbi:MAG TPA: vWA domain-containing protein [Pyrinomonadaceae bacterium]|nr:vWA domain-containing protein [Pyrinomonadaceae bacterium]